MSDEPYDLIIAGLGPGDPSLSGTEIDRIVAAARRGEIALFVRTKEHPVASRIASEVSDLVSFDELYSQFEDYDALYEEMAQRVIASASSRPTAFLVPGSPFVGESAARRVVSEAKTKGLRVKVVPGVSFIEAVLCELGVDALDEGIQIIDAYTIEEAVLGETPILVAQCHSRELMSRVKLALLEDLPAEHKVAVVDSAYSDAPKVRWVALCELDRSGFELGHATSVFVPASGTAPGRALRALVELVETLRGPGGCPWDAEQTHHSLSRHLLEETYEVLDALDALPPDAPRGEVDPEAYAALEEELGDLLFQIAFHSTLAKEAGAFTIADVARGIRSKLVARHPHVFGDKNVSGAAEVARNWETIKSEEKARESLMDDISESLPALLRAHKIQRRAASVGFDWEDYRGILEKVEEEIRELVGELPRQAEPVAPWTVAPDRVVNEIGDLLFSIVNLARHLRVDPEEALRKASKRFESRFRSMESMARSKNAKLADLSREELESLWSAAKARDEA